MYRQKVDSSLIEKYIIYPHIALSMYKSKNDKVNLCYHKSTNNVLFTYHSILITLPLFK